MQNKKGISLIVLVITIIVMIILAASVVITLSNTGVINRASQAVDLTNEAAVQDLAALTWADAYMGTLRGQDLIDKVTEELEEQGVTADKWNITVTDTGVTVASIAQETGLIEFTIEGVTYKAKEGMTWNEWVNSKYNTANPKFIGGEIDGDPQNNYTDMMQQYIWIEGTGTDNGEGEAPSLDMTPCIAFYEQTSPNSATWGNYIGSDVIVAGFAYILKAPH